MTTWKTFGKWILSGEHAVLRGVPALVFPVHAKNMEFSYQQSDAPFSVQFSGSHGDELKLVFWGLLENALEKVNMKRSSLRGKLTVTSTIPLGAGLGASAALCVGVARLLKRLGYVQQEDLFEFSRGLENIFHGESSGVDIAVALSGEGLKFSRAGTRIPITVGWQPRLYLSSSGKRGVTSECVAKVKDLWARNQSLGEKIDAEMRTSVELGEKALAMTESLDAFNTLARSLDSGRDAFHQWDLTEGNLDQHMKELVRIGAYAVKPTGSGGGGYVLSLWKQTPPEVPFELIPLFGKNSF